MDDAQHPHRKTYTVVPPGHEGAHEALQERTVALHGRIPGRSLRVTGYLAVVLLVSIASATAWFRGARHGRTVASLRSRVGLHEHEEHKSYEVNVDYRGLIELRRVEKIMDSRKCKELCFEAKGCAAWTWGKLRNVIGFSDVCFLKKLNDGEKAQKFERYGAVAGLISSTPCSGSVLEAPPSLHGRIQSRDGFCLEAVEPVAAGSGLAMQSCTDGRVGQEWSYVEKTGQIKNGHGLCLDAVDKLRPFVRLQMYQCDSGNWSQQWMFDNETGLIKNWRGSCVDAAERNIEGGMVYMQNCDTGSANMRWKVGTSGDPPPQRLYSAGSLYCFALMLPYSYEQDLLKMQHQRGVSLFACDEFSVYSNQVIEVAEGVKTAVVNSDLKCKKGGEFGTALNLDIFIAVWTKVVSDAIFERNDWTAKVDPDAVFFPERLKNILRIHPESQAGVYLNNCKFGMHGPVEVFSRNAVTAWAIGSPLCVEHFQKKCGGDCFWGEDLFIDQCLWKVLGVERQNDFRILWEDHCDPPENWDSCTDGSRVAFHPFKSVDLYAECLDNAGKPPSELPPTTPAPAIIEPLPEPTKKTSSETPAVQEGNVETEKPDDSDKLADSASKRASRGGSSSTSSSNVDCHTAVGDERCYIAVKWAMDYGIRMHPDWYEGLTTESSWYDFQEALHGRPHVDCPMPCKEKGETE